MTDQGGCRGRGKWVEGRMRGDENHLFKCVDKFTLKQNHFSRIEQGGGMGEGDLRSMLSFEEFVNLECDKQ